MAGKDPDDDIPDVPMSETLQGVQNAGGEENGNEETEEPVEASPCMSKGPPRREFVSIALGGAIVAAPTVVGLRVVLSPLFSSRSGGILARLTTLENLEAVSYTHLRANET